MLYVHRERFSNRSGGTDSRNGLSHGMGAKVGLRQALAETDLAALLCSDLLRHVLPSCFLALVMAKSDLAARVVIGPPL